MALTVGQKAPEFKLYNSEKKEITLSEFQGKNVVLLFFPLAFTSTCTKELCHIRDNLSFYNNLNAVVFGISVDSLHVLKKYKEEQNLNFELLSDFNKETSEKYGCLYPMFSYGMKGVGKRASFVVDKNGKLQFVEILENASDLPDFVGINKVLESTEKN